MPSLIDERTQFLDEAGTPLVAGFVTIGTQGADPSISPITIFSDRALTTPIANPQTLDDFGQSANKIWIPGRYSMLVEDLNNVQIYIELDNGEEVSSGIDSLSNVLGADTITAEASTTLTGYIDKEQYVLTVAQTNTGAVTLNIDSQGAKSVEKNVGEALSAGDWVVGQVVIVVFNEGTDVFQWVNRDGSDLFPTNFLSGALITRNVSDFQNFDVAAGTAVDSTNAANMTLQAFTKLADTAWAVGDAAGALLDGTLTANTAYDIWAMLIDDESSTDYGIDTVANGITNIPTGYTLSRQIGRLFTDENIDILIEIVSENDQGFPVGYQAGFDMSIGEITTAISSVTDNGGTAQFDFTPGPTLALDDLVIISGFTTNTDYNGTFLVTAIGAGTFETNVDFGSDETGSFNSQDFNTILTSSGAARDSLNVADLVGAALTKDISSTWVVGDGNGGLFSGTVAADTVYFFFAIQADADGSIDFGWDTDIDAANIPIAYTNYRLLSIMQTNSNSELIDSMQGVFVNNASTITTAALVTLDHGLGFTPELQDIFIDLVNIIADVGWTPGDRTMGQMMIDAGAAGAKFVAIYADDTSIFMRYSTAAIVFTSLNKGTGAATNLANASWRIRTRFKL